MWLYERNFSISGGQFFYTMGKHWLCFQESFVFSSWKCCCVLVILLQCVVCCLAASSNPVSQEKAERLRVFFLIFVLIYFNLWIALWLCACLFVSPDSPRSLFLIVSVPPAGAQGKERPCLRLTVSHRHLQSLKFLKSVIIIFCVYLPISWSCVSLSDLSWSG